MEKYLFFYLKTGGGHIAPAKAVAEKLKSKSNDTVDIELIDGLEQSASFVKSIIEDGYKNSINKAAWVYEFLYALHKIPLVARFTAMLVALFVKPFIEKQILETNPKKIVVFHFFLIKPIFEVIKKHGLSTKVITVVTDPFTAHPIWFLQKGQKFIVFSDSLKQKCMERGIAEEQLQVFPFVLDAKFSKKVTDFEKLQIRMNLGYEFNSKIILIMGGGEGMPRGKQILENIIARNMDAEIAIVCGKNKKLYAQAMKLKTRMGINNLKVYGFVDFVHSIISISDVVITKCGASTFMEILLMEKVPVINNYIWEQEKGNMEFVCNSKMGILERKINRLPDVLHKLITDNDFYNTLHGNIKKATLQNGVDPVSDYIFSF